MTLEEQLKDLQEKLDMTQAIKHGGTDLPNQTALFCFPQISLVVVDIC